MFVIFLPFLQLGTHNGDALHSELALLICYRFALNLVLGSCFWDGWQYGITVILIGQVICYLKPY